LAGALLAAGKEKPPITYRLPVPPQSNFSALDWLVGEWTGKTVKRDPEGVVRLSVSPDLEDHFLLLREQIELPATASVPETKESWMGILGGEGTSGDFILRVFSSTGFVTRYRVVVDKAEIHFSPEGGDVPPPGWLFRRIIRRSGVAELEETVQVAPPGKAFFDYYSAKLKRVSPPEEKTPPPSEPANPAED
jgi:hypothetical protein